MVWECAKSSMWWFHCSNEGNVIAKSCLPTWCEDAHTYTHTRTRHIWMRMGLFKHKVAYKLTSRTETFNGEHIGLVHSSLLKEFHLTKCTPSTIMKPMPSDSLFSMPSFCCRHPKRSSPSGSVIMFHSGSVSHLKIKPSPSSSPSPPER